MSINENPMSSPEYPPISATMLEKRENVVFNLRIPLNVLKCFLPQQRITEKVFRDFNNVLEVKFSMPNILQLQVFANKWKAKESHQFSARFWAGFLLASNGSRKKGNCLRIFKPFMLLRNVNFLYLFYCCLVSADCQV